MDDLLVPLNSEKTAVDIKLELTELLAKVGFKFTKCETNFDRNEVHDKALKIFDLEWNNVSDALKASRALDFDPESRLAQRKVLSVVSCFLPTSIPSTFCHQMKNHSGRNIANEMTKMGMLNWRKFEQPVFRLDRCECGEAFEVSRWYQTSDENVTNELHVFGEPLKMPSVL